jgi:hypothetical protein
MGLDFKVGRLLALPKNTKLGWKGLPGTHTVAYYSFPFVKSGGKKIYIFGSRGASTSTRPKKWWKNSEGRQLGTTVIKQRHNTQHNDTQHINKQYEVSFMLSVAFKPIMLNAVMLNVVMPSVVAPIELYFVTDEEAK